MSGARPLPKRLLAVHRARSHGARVRAAMIGHEIGQVSDLLDRLSGLRGDMPVAAGQQPAAAMRLSLEMGGRVQDAALRAQDRLALLQQDSAAAGLECTRLDRLVEKTALAMKQHAIRAEQAETERLPPRRPRGWQRG